MPPGPLGRGRADVLLHQPRIARRELTGRELLAAARQLAAEPEAVLDTREAAVVVVLPFVLAPQ